MAEKPESDEVSLAEIRKLLEGATISDEKEELPEQLLPDLSISGVIDYIKSGKCKKIITMAGAGISTSAGIPDFRSPGSGLYDNLQKYNLPTPTAMFAIDFFKENPDPFFDLARELWPGKFKPTLCHQFIKILWDKGLLLRHFTQNIDMLEREAGLTDEALVEAHGTFSKAHCLVCKSEYSQEWVKEKVFKNEIPRCEKIEDCSGLVKPDIVFFGESLPPIFHERLASDFPQCDLLIVIGTSLVVQPFASLVNRVPETTPRLYINMEPPPIQESFEALLFGGGCTFRFGKENNYRDVFWQGKADEGCLELAMGLEWESGLDIPVEYKDKLKKNKQTTPTKTANSKKKQTKTTPSKATAKKPEAKI